jgi:hypothetical protein
VSGDHSTGRFSRALGYANRDDLARDTSLGSDKSANSNVAAIPAASYGYPASF